MRGLKLRKNGFKKAMENKKIKICHVASADITVKFLLLPQLEFLKKQGYDVSVVCSLGKWIKDIESKGIKVKIIRITRNITFLRDTISLVKLFFYFKKEKFDIIHTHTPKPGLLGQLAGRLAGAPIIVNTIHGLYFQKSSSLFKKSFFSYIEKISALCSDLIFSQNKEDISTIIDKKIAPPNKVIYLGNGVDINKFNFKRFSKEFIENKKKQLGIDSNLKVVGTVGRLVKEKGHLELFSAFKKVLSFYTQTLLLIVGPEDLEKKDSFNKNLVREYGIEKNTIFLGERDDVDEIYPLMDLFVLASHREGFPRTVIEAMATERPIIATNIRGCREAIEDGITGKLVESGNSQELAEAIIFFLKNPEKAREFGLNARKKAEKDFNEEIVFDKIKECYDKIISQKIV